MSGSPTEGLKDQPGTYGRLALLADRIRAGLSTVADVEWHQSTDWAAEWNDKFGTEISGQRAVEEIRGLMDLALNSGIQYNLTDKQTLEVALADLDSGQLDEMLRRASRLLERGEPLRWLHVLGRGRQNVAGTAVGRLIPALSRILGQLETSVANRAATSGSVESELRENQARIEASLRNMISGLKVMEGSDVAAQSD